MLNIVIPMAGRGSRFQTEGYALPKPLIPVHSTPMIRCVIKNLKPKVPHRFIFICLKEHIEKFAIDKQLQKWEKDCIIVTVSEVTEGAACTVLLGKKYLNNDDQLMIANSDQWIDFNINEYLDHLNITGLDGLIMTMTADDPKWSFVKLDKLNRVSEVAEKKVISNEATVGIYNFIKGSDYVFAAEEMIRKQKYVNGEFYVAPVYNELILLKKEIGIFNIGKEADGMYGLGIPSDLRLFENLKISRRATEMPNIDNVG